MSDEYIKKLSQIKKDIGVVQDSIFFELHKLNEINKSLESRIKELESELRLEKEGVDFYADVSKWDHRRDGIHDMVTCKDICHYQDGKVYGGKRARARQKDRREV